MVKVPRTLMHGWRAERCLKKRLRGLLWMGLVPLLAACDRVHPMSADQDRPVSQPELAGAPSAAGQRPSPAGSPTAATLTNEANWSTDLVHVGAGDKVSVRFSSARAHLGMPGYASIAVDALVRNGDVKPVWFVFHDRLKPAPDREWPVESRISCFMLSESTNTVWFDGLSASFQAIYVSPGAFVRIDDLLLSASWETIPKTTEIDVFVSDSLYVGGRNLLEFPDCFASSLLSPSSTSRVEGTQGDADTRLRSQMNYQEPAALGFVGLKHLAVDVDVVESP